MANSPPAWEFQFLRLMDRLDELRRDARRLAEEPAGADVKGVLAPVAGHLDVAHRALSNRVEAERSRRTVAPDIP